MRQPLLSNIIFKNIPKEFGGELLKKSHAKTKRPISTKYRDTYSKFIRSISGIIPRIVLNARKGRSKLDKNNTEFNRFWENRPFSRIINWGREYQKVMGYIRQNILESLGIIEYRPRKKTFDKNIIAIT